MRKKKEKKGKGREKRKKKGKKVFLYCTRNDIFQKPRAQTVRRKLNEEWLFT